MLSHLDDRRPYGCVDILEAVEIRIFNPKPCMGVRRAKAIDAAAIKVLLEQLGYFNTEEFLMDKLKAIESNPDADLSVYELEGKVVGCLSIDFIAQLALRGDFARISYFVIDQSVRNGGIGREMEAYCMALASVRRCDRIEVHCNDHRKDAHQFYLKRGFVESPKYFVKKVDG